MWRTACAVVLVACGGSSKATVDAPSGDDGDGSIVPTCDAPALFDTGITPTRVLMVGSGQTYATIEDAAAVAMPGDAIRLAPGTHTPDQFVSALHGTATAPIWIGGAPGGPKPVISGGVQALQLQRANYVIVHDIEVTLASANGINIDDGGMFSDTTAAQYIGVRNVDIHDIGTGGNNDCLKVSGVNHLAVYDSHFENCGAGGSGIDHVGCHHSVIARSVFDGGMGNAVQAKGGSTDIDIRQNRIGITGSRALNLGGSTDLTLFRPPLSMTTTNAEARRIRAYANYIVTTDPNGTPFAFVGCIDCLAAHNLARGNQRWNMRILQETATQGGYTFEPSGQGRVINNAFVFTAATLATAVNVGANTDAASFDFVNNLWYASDTPGSSMPQLPSVETGGVVGMASGYGAATATWDPHAPMPEPSCTGAEIGRAVDLSDVIGDAAGTCLTAPRSIGPIQPAVCP